MSLSVPLSLSPSLSPSLLEQQRRYVSLRCTSLCIRAFDRENVLGFGLDTVLLTRVATSLTRQQLVDVDHIYRVSAASNPLSLSLPVRLRNIGGSYGNFLSSLSQLIPSFNAGIIESALSGIAVDIPLLNEIICLLDHATLEQTAEAFRAKFNITLRDRLLARLSGTRNYLSLLTQLIQSGRNENQTTDETAAVEQARQFTSILASRNMIGNLTDEATANLITLILSISYSQCQVVKRHFELLNPSLPSLEASIAARIGGGLQLAVLTLLSSPYEVLARKISEACNQTLGCDEEPIWRIIGGHNVGDVDLIALTYERMFQADMRTVIRTRTRGNFQEAIVSYFKFCPHPMDSDGDSLLTYGLTLNAFTLVHFTADSVNTREVFGYFLKSQLRRLDGIFCDANERKLDKYLGEFRGRQRQQVKRFWKYIVVDGVEVDVRAIRKALGKADEADEIGENASASPSIDQRALLETLGSKSPQRLVAARELYERLHDSNFLNTIETALQSEPVLSFIVTALIAHNRDKIMHRDDWDDGSPEDLVAQIREHLENNPQEIAETLLTHSLQQNQTLARVYEDMYHTNLERAITSSYPGLIGVALNSLFFDTPAFLARCIEANIGDPDTINRLIGGSDKDLLIEVKSHFENHFKRDFITAIRNAYPGRDNEEYLEAVVTWISSAPGFPC